MTRYKGRLYAWDVVNEVMAGNGGLRPSIWSNNFNESFISEAFILARKYDPSAKLYINDFNVETNRSKTKGLYNLVKRLREQGVPIDGVGLQCHFLDGTFPADFVQIMEWFLSLGVEVAVTEMEVAMKTGSQEELQQQAKNYATVYKTCKNHPKCVSVSVWGTTDKYSWKKGAKSCLWDADFKPRPAVAAVEEVLK